MKIRHWYIFVLVMIAAWAMATVDYKDGVAITTATHMDGFASAIAYYDGQAIASGATWDVSADQQGHWKCNDNTNTTTVVDSSGKSNNGTLAGGDTTGTISQNPGKINRSLLLNGSDDYINIDGIVNDVSSDTNGTWSLWVKPSDVTEDWARILSFADTSANEYLDMFQPTSDGKIRVLCEDNAVNKWDFTTDNVVLTNAVWTHILLTQNGISPKLFINGSEASITFTASTDKTVWLSSLTGVDNARIGCLNYNGGGNSLFINGQFDDVRIFDRVLTQTEIDGLYNSGNGTEDDSSSPASGTNFPSDWSYKIAITITNSLIDADLTDWTMVFDQSFNSILTSNNGPLDADGTKASLNGGGDIRFTSDSTGTNRLACDIRTWSTDNTATNARCEVAVLVPAVSSSSSTTIYMWWGNSSGTQPGVSETYGQYAAYDSDYAGVWDMDDNSSCIDRLGNNNLSNSNVTTGSVGKVGHAYSYNGTSSQSKNWSVSGLSFFNYTYTIVYKPTNTPDESAVHQVLKLKNVIDANYGDNYSFSHDHSSSAYSKANAHKASSDNSWYPCKITSTITGGNWYQVGGQFDGTDIKVIYNGAFDCTATSKNPYKETSPELTFGSGNDASYFNGLIDEVRITDGVRSTAWLKADYNNQFNTTGFLTWGSIVDN